ncbi:MAG: efflux RND transporter periplasmic adaptor subunit [Acidobacteriota bacterium]
MRFSCTRIVLQLPLLTLPFGLLACSGGAGANTPAPAGGGRGGQGGPVPVTVATVERKAMPIEIRVIGTAEAYSTVAVHAQITGQLTDVKFKEGDDVTEGQPLFALDRRPLETALLQAQANLDRDIAQAANAEAQAKRYQDLAERGIATREQVDTSRTGATASSATVEADRAAVENAKVQLQYATIAAPLSGRTGALMVHEGNLVRANDALPLVVINQVSPAYVSFAIPQSQLPELKRYMAQGSLRVQAAPPNETGPQASGRITFVDNAVDQTTGTIRVKGTFPNEDRRLWPGQFVNVTVTLTTDAAAIVVPSAAIQAGQQGSYAFVVKPDKTVEMRPVEVARTSLEEVVVQRGLQAGESVVTDGQLRLVPGSRISVKGEDPQKVAP